LATSVAKDQVSGEAGEAQHEVIALSGTGQLAAATTGQIRLTVVGRFVHFGARPDRDGAGNNGSNTAHCASERSCSPRHHYGAHEVSGPDQVKSRGVVFRSWPRDPLVVVMR
jgi:hypothetical protein